MVIEIESRGGGSGRRLTVLNAWTAGRREELGKDGRWTLAASAAAAEPKPARPLLLDRRAAATPKRPSSHTAGVRERGERRAATGGPEQRASRAEPERGAATAPGRRGRGIASRLARVA
jgi:hypothetical protein